MPYTVLARKYRPQTFDQVVGQRGVTQTLRNALVSGRLAQAFVFAGPRGVGKTTTARILARALNCVNGPTPDPCGACEACVEIAEGRDLDVLEIDAATHTQVDKVRDTIIAGLAMRPARDRRKIFIIDEVHRLSAQAFDALLKSIEEPPPHVVFMMATTEIEKVPETIQSRAQVFELRTLGTRAIADQLRSIVGAEKLSVDEDAILLLARSAEGSMRDAESALDQVLAFSSETVTASDVAAVLGLVGRDLLFDVVEAVASEDPAAVFELAGRAVEAGYDLRGVCRELAALVRDLMVISVDPARLQDPDIAPEGDRERLQAAGRRFSREDLLRAFDVLAKAEFDIRASSQPRYHLEMALLRWVHLRKLQPLAEVIDALGGAPAGRTGPVARVPPRPSAPAPAAPRPAPGPAAGTRPQASPAEAPKPPGPAPAERSPAPPVSQAGSPHAELREAFLEAIRQAKRAFHGSIATQAQDIQVAGDRVIFVFAPEQRFFRTQVEQNRPWLEGLATQVAGRKMTVGTAEGGAAASAEEASRADAANGADPAKPAAQDLRDRALRDTGVQAMLDVFPAEIKEVEEI